MPEILIFFLCGLAAAGLVGLAFYYAIGGPSEAAARRALGERTGPMWGRSFRMLLILMALVGGLSTQWYGCEGYQDYEYVASDRRLMFEKSTQQVSSAIGYAKWFVIVAAGLGAIVVAIVAPPAGPNKPVNTSGLPDNSDAAQGAAAKARPPG